MSEQELAVEIAEVDGININDVNFFETGENEILEELASDATGANHQHSRLYGEIVSFQS